MSDEAEAEKQRRMEELDRQIAIRETALAMGVLPKFLQQAFTAEEIEQHARDALAWKAAAGSAPAVPPQTAAAPAYPVSQMSRATLQHLSEDQVLAAWRTGRLEQIGAPMPEHNGSRH